MDQAEKASRGKETAEAYSAWASLEDDPRYEESLDDRAKRIARRLYDESTLRNHATRWALARQAASLHIQHEIIFREKCEGTSSAEESRTLPALVSGFRRIVLELKTTEPVTDTDDGF